MKYKKILTWACTAALFLTGCTTDTANNGRWMEDSNAVRIQASAGCTLTRSNPIATDESEQTGFNQGDIISVRNRNITVNYTLNGGIWQPVDNDKYLLWDKNDLKFEAFYPCDGKNTFSVGYIKKDQSTPEALAQSDYMNITSTLKSIPSDKRLPLELKRQTTRLIFKIDQFNNEFSERVKVTDLKIYSQENTNGETTADWDLITPYQIGDGGVGTTYTALVIPGVINAVLNTSEKSLDSEGEPQALYLETGTLEAGKSYTYNLIVGKNKVTVGGVTVAEWTPGTPLPGGEAKEEPPYVTMTANSKQTFAMKCAGNYTLPDLEYSVNNGKWQKVVADNPVVFGDEHGSLRLRGKCSNGTATDYQNYSWIDFGFSRVEVKCSGDIRTLIDYTAYENAATGNCSFRSLFQNCKALKSAPQLPAKALKESCYQQMFAGCTSLTQAPVLPATELKGSCYQQMFEGCASLTQAPVLPATELKGSCYKQMFAGCTALTQAPVLPATELQQLCYYSMFKDCKALPEAPKLPATKLAHSCYCEMFKGCASLVNAPDLPATTLEPSCYSRMFIGCIALTGAPELKAEKMQNGSYHSMFKGCTSLVNAPALPATTLDKNCYISMFSGCKSLETAPVLPAKKLTDWCYQLMFKDCTKLKSVTMLATEDGYNALSSWLDDAGTSAENRTLKVSSKDFYTSKIAGNNPDEWKIGANNFKVFDQNNNEIK